MSICPYLRTTLQTLAAEKTRVRVTTRTSLGQQKTYTGYVRDHHLSGADYIYLAFRKNSWNGLDGFTYLTMNRIVSITSSVANRRTKQYHSYWSENPFVLTADGDLDMSQSLKALLGSP